MITKEMVERINELARKKKTAGLTAEELAEQKQLYKKYLESVRKQVTTQLENAGIHKKGSEHHVCRDGCCEHHHHDQDHDQH